ncbi:MAG: ATP-binding protein [Chloroflexi bacterium]|nr:ATP-binding protein [Chloroflexota bacterium]
MPKSLFFRLMGAFALVILVGYSIVYVIANQATANEFHFFMFRGQMVAAQDIANQLVDYYRARGSWDGVESVLPRDANPSGGMGGMMGGAMMGAPSLWLADARGIIIAGTDNSRRGQQATASEPVNGAAIRVNGQTVGTLLVNAGTMNTTTDPSSQEFLDQVNRSLLLAGLAAAVIALALGFVLFRQITAPLDALTHATKKIATGDLKTRAVVRGEDEISRLGRSFNAMAENLEHSETARRNMLADVAHELRNPLGVIQSHLEAMLDGVFPTTPEQIASLHDETLLLTRLVDDLREIALADAGQLSLHRETTDLRALIKRTTESFQPQATEHQIALQHDLAENLPLLNLDAQRIEQVLRNLISNALRYTPANARVTVKLARAGNAAQVEVSDTGPGIPADALGHVFERFWRGDKSRSRALGGSGLGLAIAKQWIEAHGGQIGVTSPVGVAAAHPLRDGNAPTRQGGTTFWFTLPL